MPMIADQFAVSQLPFHSDFFCRVRYWCEKQPDQVAYRYLMDGEDDEIHLTYRQLDARARAIAANLQNHG